MAATGVVGREDLFPRWHFFDTWVFRGLFIWHLIIHFASSHGFGSSYFGSVQAVTLPSVHLVSKNKNSPNQKCSAPRAPGRSCKTSYDLALRVIQCHLVKGKSQSPKDIQGFIYWDMWFIRGPILKISYHSESFY